MAKRRQRDDGIVGDLMDGLIWIATRLPWWVDLILAIFSYFSLHHLTSITKIGSNGAGFATAMLALLGQYMLPIIFVFGGIASFWNSFRGKELLRSASSRNAAAAISQMSWQDFEKVIGEWFKTQGYSVTQAGGAHADGGVDIELRRNGELFLVQCKHYRAWSVPVQTIRDLYGVMTSRGAAGGFVVTSGRFTSAAKEFAEGRVITLVDGDILSHVFDKPEQAKIGTPTVASVPNCPVCNSPMVRRTARHGANAGSDFFGCSRYPACKGIVSIPK